MERLASYCVIVASLTTAILCLALSFNANNASAKTIYQYQDPQGHPVYTDQFHHGAKRMQLGDLGLDAIATNKSSSAANDLSTTRTSQPKLKLLRFKTIQYEVTIISPKPNQAIRQNQGNVNISLIVKPKLLSGDKIQVVLDGKVVGKPSIKQHITLKNIDRGTHRLKINIINEQGEIMISSQEITFHLLRFHVQ